MYVVFSFFWEWVIWLKYHFFLFLPVPGLRLINDLCTDHIHCIFHSWDMILNSQKKNILFYTETWML